MSSKYRLSVVLAVIVGLLAASFTVAADQHDNDTNEVNDDTEIAYEHEFEIHGFDFQEPEFYGVWARTDLPVLEGDVARSWLWGPAANTEVFEEPYLEADDGMRAVQYGDKSRMEMPVPGSAAAAEEDSPWAITQGLLAIELMTGNVQVGDDTFLPFEPADIPVAGDWEDNPGPTYAHMAQFMDWEPRAAGSVITQYLDLEEDTVLDDDRFAEYGVTDVGGVWQEVEGIDNNIASVFWDFMQSEGLVYEGGELTEGPLFLNEFYAIGYPTTEAYWGVYTLRGETQDILTQCFERRCLTYAPDNDPEWQVESGNVGLHYHEWRYNIIDIDDPITDDDDDAIVDDDDDAIVDDDDDGVVDDDDDGVVDDDDDGVTDDDDDAVTDDDDDIVEPDFELVLAQDDDENVVGTNHEFTATLTDGDDAIDFAEEDVEVSIERDGEALPEADIDDLNVTVADNIATISYDGPETVAVDEIDVTVTVNDTEVVGDPTLTKTWVAGEAVSLELTALDEQLQEDWEGVTMAYRVIEAQLVDEFGNPVEDEDVEVAFERTETTSAGGQGEFATIDPDSQQGTTFNADTNEAGIASAIYGVNAANPNLPFDITVEAEFAAMTDPAEITFEITGTVDGE